VWRSDDEMIEVVRGRAERVHATRRALATGVAAAVVLVSGAAVVVTRGGADGSQLRVAASGGSATSVPTAAAPVFPVATTTVPVATTVPPPTSVPPAAVPPTTVAPAPTTTPAAPRPTPAPAPVAVAAEPCSAADVVATTTVDKVDKAKYVSGEPIRPSGTLRNASGRPCLASVYGWTVEVLDASGARVWAVGASSTHDCPDPSDCSWPAGATEAASGCWDQRATATGSQVAVGSYTARITWSGPVKTSATAPFQIVPDPAAPTTTVPLNRCL